LAVPPPGVIVRAITEKGVVEEQKSVIWIFTAILSTVAVVSNEVKEEGV